MTMGVVIQIDRHDATETVYETLSTNVVKKEKAHSPVKIPPCCRINNCGASLFLFLVERKFVRNYIVSCLYIMNLYEPFYDQDVTPNNKKYSVYVLSKKGNPKLIHFGAIGYEQYKDRIGRYSAYDHLDKKRRDNYRKRHQGDKINNPNYPGYWSYHWLW